MVESCEHVNQMLIELLCLSQGRTNQFDREVKWRLLSVKFPEYSKGKSGNSFEEGTGDGCERVALWDVIAELWSVDK